jgi:hypothetical protein
MAGIFLFLGRELNFVFAGGMAALIGFRLLPLLPAQWPGWADYALIIGLALLAAEIAIANERVGYYLSGFLVGGYVMVEYYAPGIQTLPLVPFLGGGVIGALLLGIFTEWALMVVSCLFGAYYVTTLFTLSPTAEILVTSGLFVIGALTQVIIMQMQKTD